MFVGVQAFRWMGRRYLKIFFGLALAHALDSGEAAHLIAFSTI